jgi:hypothetical protein
MNRNSDVKWAEMNFEVPCADILEEYNKVKNYTLKHRPKDGHKDWYAVTLYGVSSKNTNSHWEYGLKAKKSITDVGCKCLKTIKWVNSLPYDRIDDIRFLVIKPFGYIKEHIDVSDQYWLDPLNISVTYPEGSEFYMDGDLVPYKPGVSMVLNIHYPHSVFNKSDKERLHLLVHGKKNKDFWNDVKCVKKP